jgi:hypothetical protein
MHEEVKKEKEIWLEILIERAPWETWEDNIKTDLKELVSEGLFWSPLVQDSIQWYTFAYIVMNLLIL